MEAFPVLRLSTIRFGFTGFKTLPQSNCRPTEFNLLAYTAAGTAQTCSGLHGYGHNQNHGQALKRYPMYGTAWM